jgi:hypothetical protein
MPKFMEVSTDSQSGVFFFREKTLKIYKGLPLKKYMSMPFR